MWPGSGNWLLSGAVSYTIGCSQGDRVFKVQTLNNIATIGLSRLMSRH